GTEIQMVEVNQNTLIQWHNDRQKQQLSVLLQGTAVPPNVPVSEDPLMDARVLPSVPVPAQYEHERTLPAAMMANSTDTQKYKDFDNITSLEGINMAVSLFSLCMDSCNIE
ncbi:hypothetical protein GOODEAATRI_032826, partial [Goodea atripinnis]